MKIRIASVAAAAALLALCLSTAAGSGDTKRRSFAVRQFGVLTLDVPSSWTDQVRDTNRSIPVTVEFAREGRREFSLLVTPTWQDVSRNDLSDPTAVRAAVRKAAEAAQGQAVEKALEVREFRGNGKRGFYFTATDRKPGQGEYRYMTQGILTAGEYGLLFTLLTDVEDPRFVDATIGVLLTAGRSK